MERRLKAVLPLIMSRETGVGGSLNALHNHNSNSSVSSSNNENNNNNNNNNNKQLKLSKVALRGSGGDLSTQKQLQYRQYCVRERVEIALSGSRGGRCTFSTCSTVCRTVLRSCWVG